MAKKRVRTDYHREYGRKRRERERSQKLQEGRINTGTGLGRLGSYCVYRTQQGIFWGRTEDAPAGALVLLSRLDWKVACALVHTVAGRRGQAVERIGPDGTCERFISVTQAARAVGVNRRTISRRVGKGGADRAGYRWRLTAA